MQFDIAIVGAGPVGLAAARALSGTGRTIVLVERHPRTVLENPPVDGREIALTHKSVAILERLGAWAHIPAAEISPLAEARVLNGTSPLALRFAPPPRPGQPLARLAPNHLIRRALFQAVADAPDITLLDGAELASVQPGADRSTLALADGRTLAARLARSALLGLAAATTPLRRLVARRLVTATN
jgi:2-polyprenyl-6-methoxyphenol hydroxylase-like FAD-dependent oxidoreductase